MGNSPERLIDYFIQILLGNVLSRNIEGTAKQEDRLGITDNTYIDVINSYRFNKEMIEFESSLAIPLNTDTPKDVFQGFYFHFQKSFKISLVFLENIFFKTAHDAAFPLKLVSEEANIETWKSCKTLIDDNYFFDK